MKQDLLNSFRNPVACFSPVHTSLSSNENLAELCITRRDDCRKDFKTK